MKNLFLSFSFAVIGSTLSLSSHADPMAVVKGNAVFIAADNSLNVFPDSPNQLLSCAFDADTGVFIPGNAPSIQIPLPGAIDVRVSGNHAFVATSQAAGAPSPGYVKYDVSACIPGAPFTPSVAIADLAAGELVIPCVLVGNQEFNVIMNQRGNSMNWEVIFAESGCH